MASPRKPGLAKYLVRSGPALGAEAGLLDQLALGGGEGGFVGLDAAGGQLEEELAGGVAVLALEDDVGVGGVLGLVDGEDDDRAVVADDVALVDEAAGLLDLVGVDGEDLALVGELGGDEASLAVAVLRGWLWRWAWSGLVFAVAVGLWWGIWSCWWRPIWLASWLADLAEREREVGAAIGLRYHPASGERRAASKGNADGRAGAPFVTCCRSGSVRRRVIAENARMVETKTVCSA